MFLSTFRDMIFKAKSPKGVAEEIRRTLIEKFQLNPTYVYVWSPEESALRGYGNAWSICAEEGPYEWAPELTGNARAIYEHPTVFCECYNNHIINLYKR